MMLSVLLVVISLFLSLITSCRSVYFVFFLVLLLSVFFFSVVLTFRPEETQRSWRGVKTPELTIFLLFVTFRLYTCFSSLSVFSFWSPWYNRTGRLGVKHQFTYLLLFLCVFLSLFLPFSLFWLVLCFKTTTQSSFNRFPFFLFLCLLTLHSLHSV